MLLGLGLIVFAVYCGWKIGHAAESSPVRFFHWWVTDVVIPRLSTPSWFGRAAVIFINNILILTVLMFLGGWPPASVVGVGFVGLSMGVALRVLNDYPVSFLEPQPVADAPVARRIRFGLMLNCLEPFAIVAALGLAMGRVNAGIEPEQAWTLFAVWIVPPMLIAAAGESLWIGERLREQRRNGPA